MDKEKLKNQDKYDELTVSNKDNKWLDGFRIGKMHQNPSESTKQLFNNMEDKLDTLRDDITAIKIGLIEMPQRMMEVIRKDFATKESVEKLEIKNDKLESAIFKLFVTITGTTILFLINIIWTIVVRKI